jgi:lipopolysaccharide transport system permease protein
MKGEQAAPTHVGGSESTRLPSAEDGWTLIIRPRRHWWDLRLGELWGSRELVMLFVWRDFVSFYKQTILGPLWYVIQPLLTTVVFTVIFGRVAGLSTEGVPPFLFYMAGTVVWSYFAASLTKTSQTFLANAAVFGKVYFPRMSVPVSIVISNLVTFAIQLVLFLGILAYYALKGAAVQPTAYAAFLPLLVLLMAAMGLGFGISVSALTTRYRDLQYLVAFGTQLAMYLAPIVYPLSSVHGAMRWLVLANPMTAVVETFRLGFLGVGTVTAGMLLYSTAFTLVLFSVGTLLFNRVERTFMDTV